jgi:hypothetical protein
MHYKGKGVKQDDFKALKFFQKACDLNLGVSLLEKLDCLEIILFSAIASVIHKSKLKAANAKIQITRLLVKLDYLEIILFNTLAMTEVKALNKMISKHLSFTKRRVI